MGCAAGSETEVLRGGGRGGGLRWVVGMCAYGVFGVLGVGMMCGVGVVSLAGCIGCARVPGSGIRL